MEEVGIRSKSVFIKSYGLKLLDKFIILDTSKSKIHKLDCMFLYDSESDYTSCMLCDVTNLCNRTDKLCEYLANIFKDEIDNMKPKYISTNKNNIFSISLFYKSYLLKSYSRYKLIINKVYEKVSIESSECK